MAGFVLWWEVKAGRLTESDRQAILRLHDPPARN